MSEPAKFDEWAIVEVMGHQRYAGKVTEQAIGGCNFVRVDVPRIDQSTPDRADITQAFTKLLGQASIFAITPVSEAVARHVAASIRAAPVHVYDLPRVHQAALPLTTEDIESDDDFEDQDEGAF